MNEFTTMNTSNHEITNAKKALKKLRELHLKAEHDYFYDIVCDMERIINKLELSTNNKDRQ